MYKIITRYTILWSFFLGAMLGIFLYRDRNVYLEKSDNLFDKYEKWFQERGLRRVSLTIDNVRVKNDNIKVESQFLYENVKIMCILLIRKKKNAEAANQTWAQQCNERTSIYLQSEKVQKTKLPIRQTKIESSWHIVCDSIRNIDISLDWFLFVNDDTFAIPENIRRLVAPLNYNESHYLGHATTFWGTNYNAAQAGYILSKGSIILLRNQFNSSKACAAGGRFWKQEDYYLGKHLASLGVHPNDTRDQYGQTTFHGHNLIQLLSPDTFAALQITNYYARSVFPSNKCCSPYAVTFQSIEPDKMHMYNYLLYHLKINKGGSIDTRREHHPKEDEKVWRSFVSEQRQENELFSGEMSADAYYKLWKSVVNDPINFNQNIRKWSKVESPKYKDKGEP